MTTTSTARASARSSSERCSNAASSPSSGSKCSPMPTRVMLAELKERFALDTDDVYEMTALLDYTTLFEIAALEIEPLRDPPWTPLAPVALDTLDGDIFSAIRAGDVLLHHPYESFYASVERFVREAADDPLTVSIKMTVYRVGDDTPFVQSLIRAAEQENRSPASSGPERPLRRGTQPPLVTPLEKVGAGVMLGVTASETSQQSSACDPPGGGRYPRLCSHRHGQLSRAHRQALRRRGLLTANPEVTRDVVTLFHFLTGRSRNPEFETLVVAPMNMRAEFVRLIEREVTNHAAGFTRTDRQPGRDGRRSRMQRPPFESLQAGVPVEVIVRGFCCLVPGVPGLTENVRVRSIIGRILEHSRIYHFASRSRTTRSRGTS